MNARLMGMVLVPQGSALPAYPDDNNVQGAHNLPSKLQCRKRPENPSREASLQLGVSTGVLTVGRDPALQLLETQGPQIPSDICT